MMNSIFFNLKQSHNSAAVLEMFYQMSQINVNHNIYTDTGNVRPNSLSTLSQKSETVAEKCNSLTFVRQSHFSATVWTRLNAASLLP